MGLNRKDLIRQMHEAFGEILYEKGNVCFVDILLRIGKLTPESYEAWLSGKVPYLERLIQVNLMKLNYMLRTFGQNAIKEGLLSSKTDYMSRGKGPSAPLRFSKSGDSNIEEAYATHYSRPKQTSG